MGQPPRELGQGQRARVVGSGLQGLFIRGPDLEHRLGDAGQRDVRLRADVARPGQVAPRDAADQVVRQLAAVDAGRASDDDHPFHDHGHDQDGDHQDGIHEDAAFLVEGGGGREEIHRSISFRASTGRFPTTAIREGKAVCSPSSRHVLR